MATDPETSETVAREVTRLWVHEDTLVNLVVDGDVITTTEDHPFWNETDGEWQRADQLDEGDLVRSADGRLLEVEGLDWSSARAATAYNLTVDDIHTYYVGAGEDAVLVHNTCGPYEVGRFNDLQSRPVVGDNLDIHHVPQRQPAGQTISGYDPQTAPSIALPRGEHTAIPNVRGPATLSPRDQLARDIWNLRGHTSAPNSSLQELIDLNRQLYPGAYAK